jgi:hypothetical protein
VFEIKLYCYIFKLCNCTEHILISTTAKPV